MEDIHISFSTDIQGLESLLSKILIKYDANKIKQESNKIVIEEIENFIDKMRNDPNIRDEYKLALTYIGVPNSDTIILFTNKTDERWQANFTSRYTTNYQGETVQGGGFTMKKPGRTRFGNKVEWSMYNCPKRKYLGGKLSLEYNGPDYLKDEWAKYKGIFISKIKQRIISEVLRG